MAETRPKNYPTLKNYKPSRFMLPTSHYDAEKADRAVRFIENLRHTKGKWAGKRFWLLPWQEQIIRDVFGIVDERGNRQFRTAYVEVGKKNGKSELAAAVALYLLFADNEPSAEVYGAAADRQQAWLVMWSWTPTRRVISSRLRQSRQRRSMVSSLRSWHWTAASEMKDSSRAVFTMNEGCLSSDGNVIRCA